MNKVLYISSTGLLEPLGQSQVLQYLYNLSPMYQFHVISFEKEASLKNVSELNYISSELEKHGIVWHRRRYHAHPKGIATLFNIATTICLSTWIWCKVRFEIVHCRSYIPAIAGLWLKSLLGVKFLFDMRGFWVDERVTGGLWKAESRLYKFAKSLERKFFKKADHIISLTNAGVKKIIEMLPEHTDEQRFTVIPTCVNTDIFQLKQTAGSTNSIGPVIGIVGSVGTWSLFTQMFDCYQAILEIEPDARLLMLNKNEHGLIEQKIKEYDFNREMIDVVSVNHREVSEYMGRMDVGLFFQAATFARIGSAPTKMGEFLSCGVPCLSNLGVGDFPEILKENAVGVCVETFAKESYQVAYKQINKWKEDKAFPGHCRQVAEKYFSLSVGVNNYHAAYQKLL